MESKLLDVLQELKHELPIKDFEEILELIDHNELGLAVEILVDILIEEDISIQENNLTLMKESGNLMHLETNNWTKIKKV